MILTHFLALVAVPMVEADPAPSLLPLASTAPLVADASQGLVLAPALRVRDSITLLPVRER